MKNEKLRRCRPLSGNLFKVNVKNGIICRRSFRLFSLYNNLIAMRRTFRLIIIINFIVCRLSRGVSQQIGFLSGCKVIIVIFSGGACVIIIISILLLLLA